MPSPPIQIFLTTIASQPALRKRQEYLLRILQAKRIPYTSYDLASDEKAKSLWRRKAPLDKQQLPGILVGGTFPGPFSEFEDAVEYGELDTFLRLKETWHEAEDDRPILPQQTIAVPGAHTPLQMTPEHLRPQILAANASADASPSRGSKLQPVNKRTDEFDVGEQLVGYGLQGVKVTNDELLDLVAELGLDGDDAGDLVKGLGGLTMKSEEPKTPLESALDGDKPSSSGQKAAAQPISGPSDSEALPVGKRPDQPSQDDHQETVASKGTVSRSEQSKDDSKDKVSELLPSDVSQAPENGIESSSETGTSKASETGTSREEDVLDNDDHDSPPKP